MIYYAVGTALVAADELRSKAPLTRKFFTDLPAGSAQAVQFMTGELSTATVAKTFAGPSGEPVPLLPIGLGKPLSIRVAEIYTGSYSTGIFGGSKDLLVTSAVKS